MYFATVALLLFFLPVGSILTEHFILHSPTGVLQLVGLWYSFWAVGIRLFVAGLRQAIQPGFTAKDIFGIAGSDCHIVVQELGFANICLGVVGISSLFVHDWILPASVAGGLFYGLAGARHLFNSGRNRLENVAAYSDIFVAVVLLGFFVSQFRWLSRA